MLSPHFVLFHKQRTSARLHFLAFPHGLLAFDPLPADAHLASPQKQEHAVLALPSAWIKPLAERLKVKPDLLEPEPDFRPEIRSGGRTIPVFLVGFAHVDPPLVVAETMSARFVSITDLSHVSALERALLRKAYETVIG